MDGFLSSLLAVNIAFQGLGSWLTGPMKFFSFLGSENFFLIVLPLVYWCIDAALGLRIGIMMLATQGLADVFKVAFHGPRPYWMSADVKGLASETGFGIPSGHSLTAAGVWGIAADGIKRTWAWVAAAIVVLLIGLSRIYLGVHFLHDVLVAWLMGGLILWAFIKYWDPIVARLKRLSLAKQIVLAFVVSLAMIFTVALLVILSHNFVIPDDWIANATRDGGEAPNPFSIEGMVSKMGTLFGLLVGVAWLAPRGGFQAAGPAWKRSLRFLVGLVGIAIFYVGLKLIFPDGVSAIALVFRYVRYACVGLWVSAGAPWTFSKLQLANNPNR